MVLKVVFIVVSFEVAGDVSVEVFHKLRHADKGIWLFNACEVPMVAFAAFVLAFPNIQLRGSLGCAKQLPV